MRIDLLTHRANAAASHLTQRIQSSGCAGWEYVQTLSMTPQVKFFYIQKDELAINTMHALIAARRYYLMLGASFGRMLTHNGADYRSALFARAARRLGLKHHAPMPREPTQGQAL